MNNIILGGCVIIILTTYIFFLLKRRGNNLNDLWSVSMLFKGLLGGLVFIMIGIILIVRGCNTL